MLRLSCYRVLLLLPGILTGCGGTNEELGLAPVSGTVRLDGEPLADASIEYRPETDDLLAPSSYGRTDAQGHYTLELLSNGESGAIPGEHVVSVNLPIEDVMVNGDWVSGDGQLPARYNRDTALTVTVPAEGRDDADFDLESGRSSSP